MNTKYLIAVLLLSVLLSACGKDETMTAESSMDADSEKEIDYWVAPMDPNYRRDKPGKSPMGMDLVPVYKEKPGEKKEKKEKKIAYWVAPMDPNFRRDKPGKSPMGMDLVPVYEEDEDDSGAVTISPAIEQSLGVRTAAVERSRLGRLIDTVGYVTYDESLVAHIHLRVEGWIEKLFVSYEGERVKKGDPLFELYSPELVNAQEEYLEALRTGNKRLMRSSRDRLLSLDITDSQIDALKNSRKVRQNITFYAPQDGIVTSLNAPVGMYVKPATRVMSLVDLSRVWVQVEVFERQADWVKVGQPAEMSLSFLPGKLWEGDVVYVYPELSKKTRTLKVRLQFDNPDERLKPNMYANVKLYTGIKRDILIVPSEAVINSGRMTRVLVARGEGKFVPRKVTVGIESGNYTEILSGVEEGDRVVTSGQFLIDSEASLKGSLTRMEDGE
jgi:Cu(I)/Ag(I) efflux system membrane fusion protein